MNSFSESWYRALLCCPDCKGELNIEEPWIRCESCNYRTAFSNPISIKPDRPEPLQIEFPRISDHPINILRSIPLTCPRIDYTDPSAIRDSRAFMSEIKRYLGDEGKVLDLGCGPRDQASPIEYLSYQYVGIDYTNYKADFLADAHAIPFKDDSFDCILSYAVLEHLQNPFVCLYEIERVLRPSGIYVGSISQGEPFHDSYFHYTPWGLVSLISCFPTLQINRIWPSIDTLESLSRIGRYPRVIKHLLSMVDKIHIGIPWLAPRRMKWAKQEQELDKLYRTGSIHFVIQKMAK